MAFSMRLPFIGVALMSLIVYAGSSQFVALSLIGAGAPGWTVVLMTLVVNFRHFLMSLAIARHLAHWPRTRRVLFGLQMTDETFALHLNQFSIKDPGENHVFIANILVHSSWIFGTVLGYWISWLLPDTHRFGFDFALPGMFIALIVFQARNRLLVLSGVAAAALALALKRLGCSHEAVLIAAVIGATLGLGLENKWKTASSS
jgi:4-azaleucine resistance transporter AzlC